jgi:hypothetical protein
MHEARDVLACVAAHPAQIAVHYSPPKAPELNPDEYLDGDLKQQVARRAPSRNREEPERTATRHLRFL